MYVCVVLSPAFVTPWFPRFVYGVFWYILCHTHAIIYNLITLMCSCAWLQLPIPYSILGLNREADWNLVHCQLESGNPRYCFYESHYTLQSPLRRHVGRLHQIRAWRTPRTEHQDLARTTGAARCLSWRLLTESGTWISSPLCDFLKEIPRRIIIVHIYLTTNGRGRQTYWSARCAQGAVHWVPVPIFPQTTAWCRVQYV